MRKLYHFPLCPFSRKVRIFLTERNLEFDLVNEEFWKKKYAFTMINPIGQVPVLDDFGYNICDSSVICDFIEEKYGKSSFFGKDCYEKAEIKRLVAIFDQKMFLESTNHILFERVIKYFSTSESPNSSLIRVAKNNIIEYLNYIRLLLAKDQWIAGKYFTMADIAAASHISVLDYFGDMPWKYDSIIKEWYSIIKSRPSFRQILNDRVSGFTPYSCYEKLDF